MRHLITKDDSYTKYIFFDENGSASALKAIQDAVAQGKTIDDNRRYFTLTAVIIKRADYFKMVADMEQLAKQYWGDAKTPVVLHTREIQKKIGYFRFETERKYNEFLISLSDLVDRVQAEVISITFDLLSYVNNYYKHDPYEVAFDIILETAMFHMRSKDKAALVFEARGAKEDDILLAHIQKILYRTGTKGIPASKFQQHFGDIFFNPKISKDTGEVFHGIDIADLCSYPIYRYMRFGTIGKDFEIVKKKLAGYKEEKEKTMRFPGLRKFPSKWQK